MRPPLDPLPQGQTGGRADGQGEGPGQVLHLDFVALAEGASMDARRDLMAEAGKLAALEEVVGVFVIEGEEGSDFDLAFLFLLVDFAALEPFGTNPGYARFLQGHVALLLRSFAGADVRLEAAFPAVEAHAACLALEAPEETYDWEVSATLNEWTEGLQRSNEAIGLAVGERQRYRGVALTWSEKPMNPGQPEDSRFKATIIAGRSRRLS